MNWSREDIPTQKYVSMYTIQTNNLMFLGWNDGSLDKVFGANMETPNSDSPKPI